MAEGSRSIIRRRAGTPLICVRTRPRKVVSMHSLMLEERNAHGIGR
jgi:hypothetical protein